MLILLWILIFFTAIIALAYYKAPIWAWTLTIVILLAAAAVGRIFPPFLLLFCIGAFVLLGLPLNVPFLRRFLISDAILKWYKRALPQISQTEQDALDAGTVWWDGQLFSGNPDWQQLLNTPRPTLSEEERAFLDGPVEKLCAMLNEWKVFHELNDLPPEAWQFIKEQRFLGMIIPKQYGGLGFSALAHSQVIMKLATRNATATISVMVPNSLGPAELLLHYGTEEQKQHYLPRLAAGQEVPCFALTGPEAGSDAASIPDFGIICKADFQGKKDVLGMRLTWEKRYITLGPIATLLGLAFRLYDPEHLIGNQEDLGITLALIPTDTPGVNIGRRHFPLNASFQNGPNSGKDVFIPLDWIIGGREKIGHGWRMLMECLAAGRSISLPASSVGTAKLSARSTGAYARTRTQFKLPIGRFEGVEEALARIGGYTYLMDAARVMTAGAVDLGEKPSVISAIVKYHLTEYGRQVINDAMDVHGGKAICLGPNNYLGRTYQQIPIGITVEGANILTRCLIIFGQGAIRCHPYVLKEIKAANNPDVVTSSREFDEALSGHIAFTINNAARAFIYGLTGGRFIKIEKNLDTKRYYQQLTRLSAAFALVADITMLIVGGALKRKEKLSARLGDILSHLYLCSTVLKRFEDEGCQVGDLPLLDWSMQTSLFKIQTAFDELLANFPNKIIACKLRWLIFPAGKPFKAPSDKLGHEVAKLLLEPSAARDRLTHDMFIPQDENEPIARLEASIKIASDIEAIDQKIRSAVKAKQISGRTRDDLIMEATKHKLISEAEAESLKKAKALQRSIIMVDDFEPDFAKR